MSLNTGLEGVFHYVLARLQNNYDDSNLFDVEYLSDLKKITSNIERKSLPESLLYLINDYRLWTHPDLRFESAGFSPDER